MTLTVSTDKPGLMSRILWALLVLLIVVGSIVGFIALHKFKPRPAVNPIEQQIATVVAQNVQAASGGLPVIGNGLVQPRAQVALSAEVAARVVSVSPKLVAGGTIRKGDELIRLDSDSFRASVSQGRADLNGALSSLALAEQSVKRTQELIEKGFLSRQTLDERIAARDQAVASLARARAVNRQQKISLSRTQIFSPFDGRVLKASVNAGDTVQPGRELARVFDDSALEVAVSLTDSDMALIDNPWGGDQSKAKATIMVDHGGKRYEWNARVDRVDAAIDATTRTFNVIVKALEPRAFGRDPANPSRHGPPLLVGMYASVQIAGRDQGQYVTIARDALRDGSKVWTVDADSTVRIIDVEVLAEVDDRVALSKGDLTANTKVITSDLKVVTDGMPVRIIGTPSPAKQSFRRKLTVAAARS